MIRLLLVDKIKALNQVMASVLAAEPDISIIGRAQAAADALPYLDACDVLLVTDRLPDSDALNLALMAASRSPQAKVLVMDAPDSQEAQLRYAQAGVAGYALESDSLDELLDKMRAIYAAQQAGVAASRPVPIDVATEGKPA
jgi:DNA-binding NarL/FixJ family response regulator